MPIYGWEAGRPIYHPIGGQPKGATIPEFPTYTPYRGEIPTMGDIGMPGVPTAQPFPEIAGLPTYQPTGEAYPITQLPTYKPTAEAYPEYIRPEAGVSEALRGTIQERMRGAGTAGAESAIYERGEERVQRQYEEGLKRIDEQMAARGMTGSGIHGEAIEKLETERQRSLADLSRQVTIYGQQAIESAMARGQQYVEYQSAEVAREVAVGERGWAARVGERIRGFESEARAAEVAGRSEEAAYQTAIAERVRGYESQAKAAQAKTQAQITKWQSETELHMRKYQFELQKAQMLYQAKMRAHEIGREEYTRAYEAEYRATKDTYLAEQAAREAAERKAREEWERAQAEIELQIKKRAGLYEEFKGEMAGLAGYGTTPIYTGQWASYQTPTG